MRRSLPEIALVGMITAACSRPTPPSQADAGAPAPSLAPLVPAPLAVSAETLRLVAVARPQTTLRSVELHGDSVWVQTDDGEWAMATKDGPLEKVIPPTHGLTLKPEQVPHVVGVPPHLFVLVTEQVSGKDLRPRVYVQHATDPGSQWHEVADITFKHRPVAFLPFRDGAMAISGIVDPSRSDRADEYRGQSRATTLTFIGRDDTFTKRDDLLDGSFVAVGGAADASGISIVGAIAQPDSPEPKSAWHPVGTHVHQISSEEETHRTTLQAAEKYVSLVFSPTIYRNKGITTVGSYGPLYDSMFWKPNHGTVFGIDEKGAKRPRIIPGTSGDTAIRARLLGDVLFAIRGREPDGGTGSRDLVRVPSNGPAERIEIPDVDGKPCQAVDLVAGHADELWVQASCGAADDPGNRTRTATHAVFRRGGLDQKPTTFGSGRKDAAP